MQFVKTLPCSSRSSSFNVLQMSVVLLLSSTQQMPHSSEHLPHYNKPLTELRSNFGKFKREDIKCQVEEWRKVSVLWDFKALSKPNWSAKAAQFIQLFYTCTQDINVISIKARFRCFMVSSAEVPLLDADCKVSAEVECIQERADEIECGWTGRLL